MKRFALPAMVIAGSLATFLALFGVATLSVGSPIAPPAASAAPAALQRSAPLAELPPPGATGTVYTRKITSEILKRELPYLVYEPAGAELGNQQYPVLYLLHGLGADCSQWQGVGIVREADKLIARGVIPPMVIVMPTGEDGYWMNHRPDGPRWRDYLISELIPAVEKTEPVAGGRELRAIGGISAGGHGALQLAWNNPQLFAVAGAHSPGLRNEREAFAFFGKGSDFERRDPMTLAKNVARLDLDIWIDTGESDPWRVQAGVLHQTLLDRGINHVWKPQPGGHDGNYWSSRTSEYLTFYGTALARRQNDASLRAATMTDAAQAAPLTP